MRYRKLDAALDYTFGQRTVFLVDTPETVAQAVVTRLLLWAGEWFLDADEGTPYLQKILGYGTQNTRDVSIRERILDTPGVDSILSYSSSVDGKRSMRVTCEVMTIYGPATINSVLG